MFACICYAHVPAEKRKKLDTVAEKGVFLGYKPNTKGYWILKENGSIMVSRDVTFQEISEPFEATPNRPEDKGVLMSDSEEEEEGGLGLDELGGACDLSRVSPLVSHGATPTGEASAGVDPEPEGESQAEDPSAANPLVVPRLYNLRGRRETEKFTLSRSRVGESKRGTSERRGRAKNTRGSSGSRDGELWQKAMDKEIASLLENGTWTVEKPPDGVKPVPVRWTYWQAEAEQAGANRTVQSTICRQGVQTEARNRLRGSLCSRQPTPHGQNSPSRCRSKGSQNQAARRQNRILERNPGGRDPGGPAGGVRSWRITDEAETEEVSLRPQASPPRVVPKSVWGMEKIGFSPSTADPVLFCRKDPGKETYTVV